MRLVVAVLVTAAVAYASPAAAQTSTQADEEAAKAHYLAGSAYYDQANYSDAVKEFNEAHRLSHRADLLYNISVCYERLGRWDDAIGALQQYLTERPDAPDRAVIDSRIANFQQRRDAEKAQQQAATPPPPPPPPPVTTHVHRRHVNSIVVGSIGAGLLLAAVGTGVTADATYNDLNNKCPNMVCNGRDQMLRDEATLGKGLTISTDVLLGVGAATLATGIILFIVEMRRPAAHVQLWPTTGGLSVKF
jgi:tetratricopeptide (TPR) repeat protein